MTYIICDIRDKYEVCTLTGKRGLKRFDPSHEETEKCSYCRIYVWLSYLVSQSVSLGTTLLSTLPNQATQKFLKDLWKLSHVFVKDVKSIVSFVPLTIFIKHVSGGRIIYLIIFKPSKKCTSGDEIVIVLIVLCRPINRHYYHHIIPCNVGI